MSSEVIPTPPSQLVEASVRITRTAFLSSTNHRPENVSCQIAVTNFYRPDVTPLLCIIYLVPNKEMQSIARRVRMANLPTG